MKPNILFILSFCMLLLACSDSNDPIKLIEKPLVETKDLVITLEKSNIDFTNQGGSTSISIESNVLWTTKSSASWCTVTPSSGNKSTTSIALVVSANDNYDTRSCTVTIEGGNTSKTITVNQGEKLGLFITQDSYELGNEESTIEVEVRTNVEYKVVINDGWITQAETRGLRTKNLVLNISANENYYNRTAKVYIQNKELIIEEAVIISQIANNKAILKAPADKLTDANRLPTFRWSEVSNTDGDKFSYIFEYTDNPALWQHSHSLNETVFNLSAYLEANKQYYWKVCAINLNNGAVTYSKVNTFTTGEKKSYFDGEYKIVQTNTKGANPSEILFLGDGYISEDFEEGGQFDADMDEGIEAFFAIEPYRSYREYFTVYKQAAYSKDRGVMQTDRNIYKDSKFGTNFQGGTTLSVFYNIVFEYAMKIPGVDDEKLDNLLISLVVNEDRYAGTCWMWASGRAIAISPVSRSDGWKHFSSIVSHEAGGHGFGGLTDEYVLYYGAEITESEKNSFKHWEEAGFYANAALTGDKTQVKWQHFIDAPGYDRVSTFQGAHYYSYGVWRPENSSCMIDNQKYYNAPSREAIVKRIFKTAGLEYTFEAFMENDIIRAPFQIQRISPLTFIPLAPPVMIEK